MTQAITKNYSPRISYNSNYEISNRINDPYVSQLARWLMTRIRTSAKPYHEKHKGVKNNGNPGKEIRISIDDIKKIIIKSNGRDPYGNEIYFAPVGVLSKPGDAQRCGLVSGEQRSKFPSLDRIDSRKGYVVGNVQLTTKRYNLGKSADAVQDSDQTPERATIKVSGIEIEFSHPSSSYMVNIITQLRK